jgi:hypothetical protein
LKSKKTLKEICNEYADLLDNLVKNTNDIKQLQHDFFKKYCCKKYQENCEPYYCSFRIEKKCRFIEELAKLNKRFENYGLEIKLFV